eukprot:2861991-Rhodomonas_salina.1
MVLLDKILPKLKSENHRVLIFSQFIRVLDMLEGPAGFFPPALHAVFSEFVPVFLLFSPNLFRFSAVLFQSGPVYLLFSSTSWLFTASTNPLYAKTSVLTNNQSWPFQGTCEPKSTPLRESMAGSEAI